MSANYPDPLATSPPPSADQAPDSAGLFDWGGFSKDMAGLAAKLAQSELNYKLNKLHLKSQMIGAGGDGGSTKVALGTNMPASSTESPILKWAPWIGGGLIILAVVIVVVKK